MLTLPRQSDLRVKAGPNTWGEASSEAIPFFEQNKIRMKATKSIVQKKAVAKNSSAKLSKNQPAIPKGPLRGSVLSQLATSPKGRSSSGGHNSATLTSAKKRPATNSQLSIVNSPFTSQFLPLALTFVTCGVLIGALYLLISALNATTSVDIKTQVHLTDVLVGLTIYLKTSVDFALLIGNLMAAYPGWRNRVAIEIGTAAGNALGTMIVLILWNFFRDIKILLGLMILIASLVLFRLAEDGVEHARGENIKSPTWLRIIDGFETFLHRLNTATSPVLNRILPHVSMKPRVGMTLLGLLGASFTVPFVLGLDDFAGYVPLFNVINVYGFAIGVFVGHMILNALLFISPTKTIKAVKNPIISFIGAVVFFALGIWGIIEAYKVLFLHH